MNVEQFATRALRLVPRSGKGGPQLIPLLPGLRLLWQPRATAFEASVYEPVVCLIVQGRKATTFGERTLEAGAGQCLLVSHDLPVVSRVLEAPYLSLLLDVELGLLRTLYDEVADAGFDAPPARALEVHEADAALLDALHRYLALVDSPTDAKVLGPLITKEVHYRLLIAPFGGMLRHLVRHDSQASAVARAIAHIRRDYRLPIAVAELARSVGMSTSSFHKHFKSVTASSPLQYQKDLRLLAARQLLVGGQASVSDVAFQVGYESPSQFSREYARKFGGPPSRRTSRIGESSQLRGLLSGAGA
jgi:AraC-like DNA-binding protein